MKLAVALLVAGLVCAPVASADEIVVGGAGPTQPGQLVYPAEVWPLYGTHTINQSTDIGGQALMEWINTHPGHKTVTGYSLGAVVVAKTKGKLPAGEDVEFITYGDPTAGNGLFTKLPGLLRAPETGYKSTVVARQYDGAADFPDYWFVNPVATLNAVAGFVYIHPHYDQPVSTPGTTKTETVNSQGGVTTVYTIPTEHLPLLQPLRDNGVDERLVTAIEKPLRTVIELGYNRPDPLAPPARTHKAKPKAAKPKPHVARPTNASGPTAKGTHGRRH